jgi:hypothetical protein
VVAFGEEMLFWLDQGDVRVKMYWSLDHMMFELVASSEAWWLFLEAAFHAVLELE